MIVPSRTSGGFGDSKPLENLFCVTSLSTRPEERRLEECTLHFNLKSTCSSLWHDLRAYYFFFVSWVLLFLISAALHSAPYSKIWPGLSGSLDVMSPHGGEKISSWAELLIRTAIFEYTHFNTQTDANKVAYANVENKSSFHLISYLLLGCFISQIEKV